ncbi:MAG: hypothetical protein M1835_001813 [Candelina submexicana]|nr:MAG: hypothetical protein M1835_001813 [Candelina submexicana]
MSIKAVLPPGLSSDDLLSVGLSSLVFLDKTGQGVIKIPQRPTDREALKIEKQIYERLSSYNRHCGLLAYQGSTFFDDGQACAIHLEYATNGQLSKFLIDLAPKNLAVRKQWIVQIADALDYLHINNVVHGDVSCNNVFLDDQLDAKLGDFAGSSIDGSQLLVACAISHEPPWKATPKQADIFAFGSVCYKIMTGLDPAIDDQTEVYPNTKTIRVFGDVIQQCWKGGYSSMGAVRRDLAFKGSGNTLSKIHNIDANFSINSAPKQAVSFKLQQFLFANNYRLPVFPLPVLPLLATSIIVVLPLILFKHSTRLRLWWQNR